MKNFLIKSAALAALTVISAVSCTKEQNVDASVSQPELHFIIKTAENTPVKSFIGNNLDGTYTPKWTNGDQLAIFIGTISDKTSSTTAMLSNTAKTGTTAKFEGTVPTGLTEGTFLSFSPASAFDKGYTDGTVGINLSEIQSPSSLTIDEACDVLVAKPCDFMADNGTVAIDDLFFKRIFSVVKVNLKGVEALKGEKVTSFTLSAPVTLTGRAAVDLSTASFSKWNVENQSVTANYSENCPVFGGANGLNTIWLVVNPTTVANGSTVTFSGETENYTFSKEVNLSKDLVFPQSQMAVINLSIGEGNYTAKKTVTYTVTSTSDVSVSGDAPSGSSETFLNTYTSNKNQLTGGNSMTLTLSGYKGMIVKGLTLSMKSNSSKGAGYLSVKAGSESLGSIGSSSSGVKFNDALWNGAWSTSYVDVTPKLTNTAYTVQSGENLVIVIGATANSLYCQSFTIEYAQGGSSEGGSEPKKLDAPVVTCTAKTETSLTFSWTADANASDYKVSTDDGSTYVSTQTETSYTWTGLTANTTKKLYVKAIGDGTSYTDSEAATAEGTTTTGPGSGEGGTTNYYKKVSSITSGNSYLIVGGGTSPAKIMKHPTTTAATVGYVEANVSNDQKIASSTDVDACVVTITKNGDYYTIAFDSNYISAGGSNTDLKITTTAPSSSSTDNANWVISTVTSYGSFQIKNSKQDKRAILWRSGSINKFGNYAASTIGTEYYYIDLYELAN